MVSWEAAELAGLRAGLYRFFGVCLRPPRAESVELLAKAFGQLDAAPLEQFAFYGPWRGLKQSFETLPEIKALEADYSKLFLSRGPQPKISSQESIHLGRKGSMDTGYLIAEVEQAYRQMGLQSDMQVKLPPDHLLVELEALAFLCRRELEACQAKDEAAAAKAREQQLSFLADHLALWLPYFARAVAERSATLYGPVAEAAAAFVTHELLMLENLSRGASA